MKKHNKFTRVVALFSLLLLFVISTAVLDYFSGYEIYSNVKYGDKAENVMDLYIPNEAYKRENNGCVLLIHGGSWSGGDKSEEAARARLLAGRGYIVATMNYTLWSEDTAEEYTVSLVLDEIDAALAKVSNFAQERGIRVEKAATAGYSAGAHLAMLYAYSRADSSPIEIVFTANMAGPAEISADVWGDDIAIIIGNRLSSVDITEEMLASDGADEVLASISPTSFISKSSPPTLIMHGDADTVVPRANAELLADKLADSSVRYDYVRLKDSDHSLMQNPLMHAWYYKLMIDYCEQYFQ